MLMDFNAVVVAYGVEGEPAPGADHRGPVHPRNSMLLGLGQPSAVAWAFCLAKAGND